MPAHSLRGVPPQATILIGEEHVTVTYAGKFIRIAIALVAVVGMGTLGYVLVERWSWFDALYMTIVTLSTVGFQEVHALSVAGRVLTMGLVVVGVGVMLYAATTAVQYVIEGNLGSILGRRRMREDIAKLKEHIILCGYGKIGQEVAQVLREEGVKFVVVESSREIADSAIADGCLTVHGDATTDEALKEAGIKTSRALIAALGSDADNLYVTLSAKGIRPDVYVVARVFNEESEAKLKRAGADRTMSPYRVFGRRLATLTLRPVVVDFLDAVAGSHGQEQIMFENVRVQPGSHAAGITVRQWLEDCGGAQILAIKKKDGRLIANPPMETTLEAADELVVAGTYDQLKVIDPLLT